MKIILLNIHLPTIKNSGNNRNNMGSNDENVINNQDGLKDLATFQLKRVISNNKKIKTICLEGTFTDRVGAALLLFVKQNISFDLVKKMLSENLSISKVPDSDLYECFPEAEFSGVKVTLIFPATERHIKKFEPVPFHLINETADLYRNVTLPCITRGSFNLQWVYNILTHKSETESIIFEDEDPSVGFMFLPDLKWNQKTNDDLYVLAIARPRDIKSLRDITAEHLPLLRNIRDKGLDVIKEKFGLKKSQVRIYIHYQPSYYHFHVHFTNIEFNAPGIWVTKSHLLQTVISNLEVIPNYYQKTTLSFLVKETESLFLSYKEKGLVKELPPKEVETNDKDSEKNGVKLSNVDEVTKSK